MSILTNLFTSNTKGSSKSPTGPETAPVKMNLEERMAFRREMLYECIKTTLSARKIFPGNYKFKVVRNDKRGHQFSVMVDLAANYLRKPEGQPEHLQALAAAISKNAMARYGLGVAGVYWRVDEQLAGYETVDREAAEATAAAAQPPLTPRQKYERATADELAAFEAAWQKSHEIEVGDRVYSSDLAPLEGEASGETRR